MWRRWDGRSYRSRHWRRLEIEAAVDTILNKLERGCGIGAALSGDSKWAQETMTEAKLEIERLHTNAKFAEERLSRWLAHQYSNTEQYKVLREARDKLKE
jgi:adenosyl cobinamide kinase/adenosyl cobinamide phosphate guanylyltransferase